MQSIQATVLASQIQIGETPIFIIAPTVEDGSNLSILLSKQIVAPHFASKLSGIINADNNYFFHKDAYKTLIKALKNSSKKQEQNAKIKLTIDEAMDSGKLWGLQCDYPLFFEQNLVDLYEDAFFIIIYNNNENILTGENYIDAIASLKEKHPSNTIIIHENNVIQLPELLLQNLPLAEHNVIKEIKTDFKFNLENIQLSKQSPSINKLNDLNFFKQENIWFEGDDLLIILLCDEFYNEDRLKVKLEQITTSFLTIPRIHLHCHNNEHFEKIEQQLHKLALNDERIKLVKSDSELSVTLNNIINQNTCPYILIDNFSLAYSLSKVLSPYKNIPAPTFTFGRIIDQNSVTENPNVTLADILTTHLIQDNISFSKHTWQQLNGFDELLSEDVTIWDFAIRALQIQDSYAQVANSVLLLSSDNKKAEEQNAIQQITKSKSYKRVIEKHKHIFQNSLNHVLQLISVKHHLPQNEIKNLNYKILTLQSLLAHSKDELKALNELSATLQRRVQALESKWHYKVGREIKRIKKIFFKKKTPGTSNLKKLLKFFSFMLTKPGVRIVRKIAKGGALKLYLVVEDRPVKVIYLDNVNSDNSEIATYDDWIKAKLVEDKLEDDFKKNIDTLTNRPKISIVMPVYNPPVKFLKKAIESVINQLYQDWELCIADDCSPNPQVRKLLHAYSIKDNRIKVNFRTENGHISACSNSALQLATGEYILLLDHDDLLTQNCLFEVIKHINEHPEDEIIYSDEDKIDDFGTHSMPHFKPDWAPHNLMSRNYFGHVVVIKKSIMNTINGFRLGFEGSQDYDLLLRATEIAKHIGHIPKVLYHWRIHSLSAAQSEDVKPYAYIAAKKALEETLQRRGDEGEVQYLSGLRGYRIKYQIKEEGKVSIIIPTKDQVKLLKNTIDSIINNTDYKNFEIILLNNNSSSKEFFELVDDYNRNHGDIFQCIDANFPFNFAKLMNIGVAASKGDYILFLNNDVEIIHADWLRQMVSYAQHKETGAVGVKLLYPDDNIQHAGVIVGLGGVAGHAFVNAHRDDSGYFNYIQSVNNFSAVTAACMLCRKEVYEAAGGMDETLEVEYNDVDLCLNIMKAGYYNVYLPDVELYHYESATRGHPHQSKESWERHVREIALFKSKWQHIIDRDPFYNPNLNLGTHDFSLNFSA